MREIRVRSRQRNQMIAITSMLQELVNEAGLAEGVVVLQCLHTTAALTINEDADPDVVHDLLTKAGQLVPKEERYYRHAEGNSDSHLKTSIFGPSLTVLVSDGRLVLGTWQGVFLCEFDGPRERRVAVQVLTAE